MKTHSNVSFDTLIKNPLQGDFFILAIALSFFLLIFAVYLYYIATKMSIIQRILSMSWKKWLLVLGILAVVVVWGWYAYTYFFTSDIDSEDYLSNDMVITRWDIINSLSMNGRAKFSDMQKLTFPNSGRITGVYKKVGDLVKAGELIAKMDTYEIDNELEQARIDLENEERALERALDTSKKELSVLEAEKKYQALLYEQQTADDSLKLALQTIENDYVNKKNEYQQSLRDYEKKLKDYETMKKTYEEIVELDKSNTILHSDEILKNKVEDLKFAADGVKKELDALDKIMIYSTKYGTVRPGYYIYIWAEDIQTRDLVESLFWKVSSSATLVYDWADTVKVDSYSEVQLKSLLIQYYEYLRDLADQKTELSKAVEKMVEASIESSEYSLPSLSIPDGRSLKTAANTAIDEILGLKQAETIGEKRENELQDMRLELDKMKQSIDKLKIEYDQLDIQKSKKVSDAKMDYEMKSLEVKIAKSDLEELRTGDNEEIKQIRNNIKQKQKQIETIMKKYDDYSLKANFDGVITKMNIQVGDTAGSSSSSSNSEEKYVYIENPDNMEIELDVDQSDIVKLSVGMSVQIVLDALPGAPYTGTLLEIDTTAGDDMWGYYWWGTSYKAKVVFTKRPEDTILGAMTAMITITLEEKYDVLMVPNIAISFGNEGPMVMKVVNGKYKKVPVEIGISDQANTEIVSWLEEGDIIMGVFIDKEGIEAAGLNEEKVDPWASWGEVMVG